MLTGHCAEWGSVQREAGDDGCWLDSWVVKGWGEILGSRRLGSRSRWLFEVSSRFAYVPVDSCSTWFVVGLCCCPTLTFLLTVGGRTRALLYLVSPLLRSYPPSRGRDAGPKSWTRLVTRRSRDFLPCVPWRRGVSPLARERDDREAFLSSRSNVSFGGVWERRYSGSASVPRRATSPPASRHPNQGFRPLIRRSAVDWTPPESARQFQRHPLRAAPIGLALLSRPDCRSGGGLCRASRAPTSDHPTEEISRHHETRSIDTVGCLSTQMREWVYRPLPLPLRVDGDLSIGSWRLMSSFVAG